MDSINAYGFFDQNDPATVEEYAGRHWACYQCSVPDYEMVRWNLDGSQTLVLRCPVNRFAPFPNSAAWQELRSGSAAARAAVKAWIARTAIIEEPRPET